MLEIASTQGAAEPPSDLFAAMAEVRERVAASPLGALTPEQAVRMTDLEDVLRAFDHPDRWTSVRPSAEPAVTAPDTGHSTGVIMAAGHVPASGRGRGDGSWVVPSSAEEVGEMGRELGRATAVGVDDLADAAVGIVAGDEHAGQGGQRVRAQPGPATTATDAAGQRRRRRPQVDDAARAGQQHEVVVGVRDAGRDPGNERRRFVQQGVQLPRLLRVQGLWAQLGQRRRVEPGPPLEQLVVVPVGPAEPVGQRPADRRLAGPHQADEKHPCLGHGRPRFTPL
jgi:hypothetical protein